MYDQLQSTATYNFPDVTYLHIIQSIYIHNARKGRLF